MCVFVCYRYYEFEVITPGNMRVGFAMISLDPGTELGTAASAYVFDGMLVSEPLDINLVNSSITVTI